MFKNDKQELEFYRKFMESMNASNYVLNLEPWKMDWISPNEFLMRVTGMSPEQLISHGDQLGDLLLSEMDYEESKTMPVNALSGLANTVLVRQTVQLNGQCIRFPRWIRIQMAVRRMCQLSH